MVHFGGLETGDASCSWVWVGVGGRTYRLQTPESKSTGAVTSSAEVMCTEPVPVGYVRYAKVL